MVWIVLLSCVDDLLPLLTMLIVCLVVFPLKEKSDLELEYDDRLKALEEKHRHELQVRSTV